MLDTFNDLILKVVHDSNIFRTIFVVLFLVILQRVTLRYLGKKKWASETIYLRVHTHVRNAFLALITISIITIWIPQIQSFALSIAAIAVAFVVSLKEIITMLTGGFIRTSTDLFSIGDRIEVNHFKGDVIRSGFFTTDLLEVGECDQRTGRILQIPNSFFFTAPVINETVIKNYTFHVMTFPIAIEKYSPKIKESMLDYTKKMCAEFIEKSEHEFKKFARKNAMTNLSVEPRILVKPFSHEQYHLVIRVPLQIHQKIKVEQDIFDEFDRLTNSPDKKKVA